MSAANIINQIIEREGGFVDHVDDKGGATRFGITENVARQYGYRGSMRDLPRHIAFQIYETIYFREPGFHLVEAISPVISEELTDTGVNMGPAVSSRFLQRCLNVLNRSQSDYLDIIVDGHIGQRTIDALNAFMRARPDDGVAILMKALNCLQGARYIELAERREQNESFVFGWLKHRVSV